MNTRAKKRLIGVIGRLDNSSHENIFEIIIANQPTIKYSKSGKSILINLAKLELPTLQKVHKFVEQYQRHIDATAERDLFYEKAKISVNDMLDNDYNFTTITSKTHPTMSKN